MEFSSHQILFLQRLARERPDSRAAGATARYLCEHYSIGVSCGSRIDYRGEHHELARALLLAHNLPLEALPNVAKRSDVAQFDGMSEKALSVAPHADSIAVRCMGSCMLDSAVLVTPPGSYLVVTSELGHRIACERLMLVENLQAFRDLDRYWWIGYRDLAVLAVYRGDAGLSNRSASAFVHERTEPIWAFVDFDPAGLLIANALPAERLDALVLPDQRWLRQAGNTPRGRQLFDTQERQSRNALERALSPAVRAAWEVLSNMRSGVTQERMMAAPVGRAGGMTA